MTVLATTPAYDHEGLAEQAEALGLPSVACGENDACRMWAESAMHRRWMADLPANTVAGFAIVTGVLSDAYPRTDGVTPASYGLDNTTPIPF